MNEVKGYMLRVHDGSIHLRASSSDGLRVTVSGDDQTKSKVTIPWLEVERLSVALVKLLQESEHSPSVQRPAAVERPSDGPLFCTHGVPMSQVCPYRDCAERRVPLPDWCLEIGRAACMHDTPHGVFCRHCAEWSMSSRT
jgi:hypothetical protein